jgi:Holin family.
MKTELMVVVSDVFHGFLSRISELLSNAFGRLCCLIVFLGSWLTLWLGDIRITCLGLVISAVVIDLIWGCISSAKRKKFAISIGFTKTVIKMVIYGSVMALAALIEKSVNSDITMLSRAAASILIVAETISVFGHILIVKPNAPVIKLLWKLLRSEVAKKLGITVDEVEALYNNINSEK